MTSEVLMLNRDAVVVAADSAVTTGRAPHPRYSKAANKIFDVCRHGNVALTIYGSADIDRVPWELAAKLFRSTEAHNPQHARLLDYETALLGYLQGNTSLFPQSVRDDLLKRRLFAAAVHVLSQVDQADKGFTDLTAAPATRQTAWAAGSAAVAVALAAKAVAIPLTAADVTAANAAAIGIQAELAAELATEPKWQYANAATLSTLAAEALVKVPADFLSSTGVVLAGYGHDEIFPSFTHIRVFGHIGSTIFWTSENRYAITHDNEAWIQSFAQSSMIDRFTDGFDSVLAGINGKCGNELIANVFNDLTAAGISISPQQMDAIRLQRHPEFMKNFRDRNWNENFYPLRRVLNSLSVPEMGHLAESLLVLEALRERVTSPSESVGGPIDVAVVSKAEGLVWLKRKHYFEPELNLRYLNRSKAQ